MTDSCAIRGTNKHFPYWLRILHLYFKIIPINPCLISCCDVLKNVLLTSSMARNFCLTLAHFYVWCGMEFALTWHVLFLSVRIRWHGSMLMTISLAFFRTVKRRFSYITSRTFSTCSSSIIRRLCVRRLGSSTKGCLPFPSV